MIKHGLKLAVILLLGMVCSQVYATHYQYVMEDTSGVSIGQGATESWDFDLTTDEMYLWELTSPTSTPGGPTPDTSKSTIKGSYDPAYALHYVYLRIDPNKVHGDPTSSYISVTINGTLVEDWSNPIRIYDWGFTSGSTYDPYEIVKKNYSFKVQLEGLSTLGTDSIQITNVNIEGCFDKGTPVPVPAAIWLFGSGLLGYLGMAKRKRQLGA